MIRVSSQRQLYANEEQNLAILSDFGTDNTLFESVLSVREAGNQRAEIFSFDHYSNHYVLFDGAEAIGTLTVTRNRDGEVDCRQHYPDQIFQRFGDQILSGCKLRILPNRTTGMFALRLMFREGWRDQVASGVHLDVINVHRRLVPFYRRIGYLQIKGADFIHPTLGTDSVVMYLPADPCLRSFCRDIFEAAESPLRAADVQRALELEYAAGPQFQRCPI